MIVEGNRGNHMKSERILRRWALLTAGNVGPFLAGQEGVLMRTSTPLVSFDANSLTGITASGRPYRLAEDADPNYALNAFHSLWDAGDADVRVLSPEEAAAMLAERPNDPFDHTPEEQADLDAMKLAALAGDIRLQAVLAFLAEPDLADLTGLPVESVERLLAREPDALHGVSPDDAECALERLVLFVQEGIDVRHGRRGLS